MRIRTGKGLGDTIYLRPIVEHFIRSGKRVTALVDYPEILEGTGASTEPFRRNSVDVVAHYVDGKSSPNTTQWFDMCASAGIKNLSLSFHWNIKNYKLLRSIDKMANGRKIILVHGGRAPYGRQDGFGNELVPTRDSFACVLNSMRNCFRVLIGKDSQLYPLSDCADFDLSGNTSVSDLLDLGKFCNGLVAQCSFAVPLAEVFNKPLLAVWSSVGLESVEPYIKATTPKKILSKPTSHYVLDSWDVSQIAEHSNAFCRLL